MEENRPAEGEAPAEPAATGWRAGLQPASQPNEGDANTGEPGDSGQVGDESAEGEGRESAEAGDPGEMSEEETASWRSEVGIPEDPNGYDLPEIKGHTWSESDAPILESFFTAAHAANIPKETAGELIKWHTAEAAKQAEAHAEAQRERDEADKATVVSALTTAFGQEGYKPAVQSLKRLLGDTSVFGKGVGEQLAGARLANGRLLINEPSIAKLLIDTAKARYSKGGTREVEVNKAARRAEIEKIMKRDIDEYYAEGLDKEYLELMKG